MLLEGWGSVTRLVGKGHPELNASEASALLGRRLLRVRDPPPRRHQVQHPGDGQSLEAEAVVMKQITFEQPGDGLEPNMGMRRHIHRLSGGEGNGAIGIEETPGSDRPSLTPGEEAPDRETAEVCQASRYSLQRRPGGCFVDAQFDLCGRREIAHRGTSLRTDDTPRVSATM